jgi:hypothetical protein
MMKMHFKDPDLPIQINYPHTIACNGENTNPDNYTSEPSEVTCIRCLKKAVYISADDELRENLAEFSKHIQAVGRMIGSTKITFGKLEMMKTCLEDGVKTLDTYLEMLKKYPTLL